MKPVGIDGFMASLLAAESIRGCRGILHGPGACRGQNCGLVKRLLDPPYNGREGPFFYGTDILPCTHLDADDFIHGANYKMEDLLDMLDTEMAVVIMSPGASLIGDDLTGTIARSKMAGKVYVQETSHMSEPACVGYDCTIRDMVRFVCTPKEKVNDTVNIVGLPVLTEGWKSTKRELTEYLTLMGLKVTAAVGCDCSVDELRDSASAEFNITVLPEYCRATSEEYSRLGVPTVDLPVPFGYSATRKWIEGVADATGHDPAKALELIDSRSSRVKNLLINIGHGSSITRGLTYSVCLDSEITVDLVKWLYSYLGMFPRSICGFRWWSEQTKEELTSFLESIRCADALDDELGDERCNVLFSDGYTAALYQKYGKCQTGVDMQEPTSKMYGFLDRPILGADGADRILDDIFNGLFSPHY